MTGKGQAGAWRSRDPSAIDEAQARAWRSRDPGAIDEAQAGAWRFQDPGAIDEAQVGAWRFHDPGAINEAQARAWRFREATLCFLLRGGARREALLGLKKVGFGQGKYGGVGGKVEPGEAPIQAAARELYEETGIIVAESDLQPAARLAFRFPHKPEWTQTVHVFTSTSWTGEASESREIVPAWFAVDAIPFERMWDDCRYWLPRVLAGERVRATFVFSADNDTVEEFDVRSWK